MVYFKWKIRILDVSGLLSINPEYDRRTENQGNDKGKLAVNVRTPPTPLTDELSGWASEGSTKPVREYKAYRVKWRQSGAPRTELCSGAWVGRLPKLNRKSPSDLLGFFFEIS